MMSAERYRDADVRAKPSLMAMAVSYAQAYRGDFDFMQAASAAANATGTLPIAVARGVLNCMRADPEIADRMPEAMAPDPLEWQDHFKDRREAILKDVPKPKLTLVPRENFNAVRSVTVNFRIKHPYWWNPERWEGAPKYIYHIISAYSYVDMFVNPHHGGSQHLQLHLKGLCGYWHSKGPRKLGANPPADFQMCGSCAKQIEVYGRRYERERNLGE